MSVIMNKYFEQAFIKTAKENNIKSFSELKEYILSHTNQNEKVAQQLNVFENKLKLDRSKLKCIFIN